MHSTPDDHIPKNLNAKYSGYDIRFSGLEFGRVFDTDFYRVYGHIDVPPLRGET